MSQALTVSIQTLPHHEGLPLPEYMSEGAAGMDLSAAIDQPITIQPGERCLVPTGLVFSLPMNVEAQIRPRSGLAFKHGITILNAPGTIDSDYRGEIKVIIINLSQEPFAIKRGERIAQVVFAPYQQASFKILHELDVTKRQSGGFGHTGI